MTWVHRFAVAGTLAAAGAMIGCAHHHHEPAPQPVAVGYYYEPGYYDRGYYQGNDWYWRDRSNHVYYEPREEHEQRMQSSNDRRDEHSERHEERR